MTCPPLTLRRCRIGTEDRKAGRPERIADSGHQRCLRPDNDQVDLPPSRELDHGLEIAGIGGNLALPNGLFPFNIPVIFPNGIPAIVFAAIVGILMNTLFLLVPPSLFGVKERENINL